MKYRKTHAEGPVLSEIITGVWRWDNLTQPEVRACIAASEESGITSFDHADIYGDHTNEESFGRVLGNEPSLRQRITLITKCGILFPSKHRPATRTHHYNTSAEHIIWSAENSLRTLRTDYLDMLLIHRPDPLTDPADVARAFSDLKQSGKVLHFGVSNFSAAQFRMLQRYVTVPLVTNQVEISLAKTDSMFNGDLDVLMEYGVAPMAWSPLAGGQALPGAAELATTASTLEITTAQLALAWLLTHPSGIFPVIGTSRPERIRECAQASDLRLSRDDWFTLLKAARGFDIP